MAKQMTVMAISEMIYGTTIRILWLSGNGPENRDMDRFSIGPTETTERVDLRMGSMIVAVASVYNSIGEVSEIAFMTLACLSTLSVSPLAECGVMELLITVAPSGTKNEKKIHIAKAARADVAVLRNKIEKRMATPSHNEI